MNLTNLITADTILASDTHFGHTKIDTFMPMRKTFADQNGYKSFDEYMALEWIKRSKQSNILCLGDFAFKSIQEYGKRVNIRPDNILLIGNHDLKSKESYIEAGFGEVITGLNVSLFGLDFKYREEEEKYLNCFIKEIDGLKIMFSHFPVFDDNPYDAKFNPITSILERIFLEAECDINIHGHTHAFGSKEDFCINVSIEDTEFKFPTIGEVIEKWKREKQAKGKRMLLNLIDEFKK